MVSTMIASILAVVMIAVVMIAHILTPSPTPGPEPEPDPLELVIANKILKLFDGNTALFYQSVGPDQVKMYITSPQAMAVYDGSAHSTLSVCEFNVVRETDGDKVCFRNGHSPSIGDATAIQAEASNVAENWEDKNFPIWS